MADTLWAKYRNTQDLIYNLYFPNGRHFVLLNSKTGASKQAIHVSVTFTDMHNFIIVCLGGGNISTRPPCWYKMSQAVPNGINQSTYKQGKQSPVHAWTGLESSRRILDNRQML
jgi:hypothetical protein